MEIAYKATFVRKFKKLESHLQNEVLEKIELLKFENNHSLLKVHKLHGNLNGTYSFYVNYKIRVVFIWEDKKEIILLAIGDHDIYK